MGCAKLFCRFLAPALLLGQYACLTAWAQPAGPSEAFGSLGLASDGVFLVGLDGERYAQLGLPATSYPTFGAAQWSHPKLGTGQALDIEMENGDTVRVIDLPDSPFVLLQRRIVNNTAATAIHNQVRPFSLSLSLGPNPDALRALGTAGLTPVDGHAGSYTFLAVAAPETRSGVVSGWLSQDRGSGVVFSTTDGTQVRLEPLIEYGRLLIDPGGAEDSELFAIGYFDDARLGLEAYADLVAKLYAIDLPPILDGYCTWYSKKYGGACDEEHLKELSEAAAAQLKPYGFDFIQIDDKWQEGERREGPAKNFYAHKPGGPYPGGMKAAADHIRSLGLVPGIWFMPFAGDHADPFFQEHLDWFVKAPDGSPYWARWGGTSLDMTNPDARAYVRSVVSRIAHDWGYTYFKMDGLWTGTATEILYVNNAYKPDDIGTATFHDPEKTPIEAYRDGLKLVRDAAGPDVFFLGCNVSQNMRTLGASFGLLDAMRIGPDNAAARNWNGLVKGPWHGTNRYFLHGRVWHNDPDPVGIHPEIPIEQARLVCSWVGLSGQLNVFSEWLPEIPQERIDLWRKTLPNHGLLPRPVDLFEQDLACIWLLTGETGGTRRDVIGLFNWKESEPADIDYDLEKMGLSPDTEYIGFDFWGDALVPPFSNRLQCTIAPGACKIIAVRPEADRPQVISTLRHITQGIVDIVSETWDAETRTLSGQSWSVPGEAYEVRVVLPKVGDWQVDAIDGADWTQEGRLVRARFTPNEDVLLDWHIQFEK